MTGRLGLVVGGVALAWAASTAGAQGVGPGRRAPEIKLKTLEGQTVRLSEFRGHPLIVTFWATWCPPCRDEFPALVAARERHRDAGLQVLAVNQLDQELRGDPGKDNVRRFLAEFAVTFPVVLDPRASSREAYQVLAFPTTVFIDSAGVIRQRSQGPLTAGELERGLAAILTAGKVPPG